MSGPHLLAKLQRFANRRWYAPLVGFFAGADQFIILIPIEALLIPGVLANPRRWLRTTLWIATGCALGAAAMAAVAHYYGQDALMTFAPSLLQSEGWARATRFLANYGAWAVFLIALGPFPQQPAVALAGLSKIPLFDIFAGVLAGRALKYALVAWLASHAPRFLEKIPGFKTKEIEIHAASQKPLDGSGPLTGNRSESDRSVPGSGRRNQGGRTP